MANLGAYLLDPLVDALKTKVVDFVSEELRLTTRFEDDLKEITEKFEEVRALLVDAEKKSLSDDSQQLMLGLKRIKDSAYDIEDFIEDIRNPNVELAPIDISDHVMRIFFFLTSLCSPVMEIVYHSLSSSDPIRLEFQRRMGHMMKGLNQSLDGILRKSWKLGLTTISSSQKSTPWVDIATSIRRRNPVFSTIDDSVVFGRDDDKNNIIKLLIDSNNDFPETSESNKACSVIAIVGIGGLGKTTLARLVFNDKKIQKESKFFDVCLWVSVPVDFNLKVIIRTMFKNCRLHGNNVDEDLEYMSRELKMYLRENKIFMVMDDVWSEDRTKWESFMGITKDCKKGSKILITTRSEVSKSVRADHVIPLKGLSDDASWKVFHKKAFDSDEEMNEHPNLHNIGKDIVKKCMGVPLALNAIGAMLYDSRSENFWKKYLSDIDIWESIENSHLDKDQKVLSSLKLTFSKMTSELKRCFTYCSIFSKEMEIEKEDLIYQWMTHGYTTSYDTGEQHFQSLLWICFLQVTQKDIFEKEYFKMHDLARDLARHIASDEVILYPDQNSNIPETCRYLQLGNSIDHQHVTPKIKAHKLRALIIKGPGILTEFKDLRYLRMLILNDASSNKIPTSLQLGTLCHLRYLHIDRHGSIEEILVNIMELNNLQVLKMRQCDGIVPDCIDRLKSLEFLEFALCPFVSLPDSIVKLENLRFLHLLHCEELKELPESIGEMNELRSLSLVFCRCLSQLPDSIGDMKDLNKLDLSYCSSLRLLPHSIIELTCLEYLHLDGCPHLWRVPRGIERMVLLKTLNLELNLVCTSTKSYKEMTGTSAPYLPGNSIFCDFEYLFCTHSTESDMEISGTSAPYLPSNSDFWEFEYPVIKINDFIWDPVNLAAHNQILASSRTVGLSLTLDEVDKHRAKSTLDSLKPSLKLQKLTLRCYSGQIFRWMRNLKWLRELNLEKCTSLTRVPKEFLRNLTSLQHFRIEDCKNLEYLSDFFEDLVSLSYLHLLDCPKLKFLYLTLPVKLERMIIEKCDNFVCLLLSFGHLALLSSLELKSCPNLKYLPIALPIKLERMIIENCQNFEYVPHSFGYLDLFSSLELRSCPKLQYLPLILPIKLEKMIIENCKNLEHLPESFSDLASLWFVEIKACSKLKYLPITLPIKLERMIIENCVNLECLPESFGDLALLSSLELKYYPKLKYLPATLPINLKRMIIENCENLECLPESFGDLTLLSSLKLKACLKLKYLTATLPMKLQYISIENCENLECLPESFGKLTSLSSLELRSYPKLKYLPATLPTKLERMIFENCENLECLPESFGIHASLWHVEVKGCPKFKLPATRPQNLKHFNVSNCGFELQEATIV